MLQPDYSVHMKKLLESLIAGRYVTEKAPLADDLPIYCGMIGILKAVNCIYPDFDPDLEKFETSEWVDHRLPQFGDLVRYCRNIIEGPFEVVLIEKANDSELICGVYTNIDDAEYHVHEGSSATEGGHDFHDYWRYEIRPVVGVTHYSQLPSDTKAICGSILRVFDVDLGLWVVSGKRSANQKIVSCSDCLKRMNESYLLGGPEKTI